MQQSPKLMDLYQSLINDITDIIKDFPLIPVIAAKTNRKSGELFLLLLVIASMLTATGFLGHYFTIAVGVILGVLRTLQSEQKGTVDQKNQWLTYWVAIGAIINLDFIFGGLLDAVPFYNIGKLLFVISMSYPKSDLAGQIYRNLIKPRLPLPQDNKQQGLRQPSP